jgi:hypothetical protein
LALPSKDEIAALRRQAELKVMFNQKRIKDEVDRLVRLGFANGEDTIFIQTANDDYAMQYLTENGYSVRSCYSWGLMVTLEDK